MHNFGFVKRNRSRYLSDIKENQPFVFLVYDTVAERALWELDPKFPQLQLGEAIVSARMCGISDQSFETSLQVLENDLKIEILHRGLRDKNSKIDARNASSVPRIKPGTKSKKTRNESRINGTVVKLTDSTDYDLNLSKTPEHIPYQISILDQNAPERLSRENTQERKKTLKNDKEDSLRTKRDCGNVHNSVEDAKVNEVSYEQSHNFLSSSINLDFEESSSISSEEKKLQFIHDFKFPNGKTIKPKVLLRWIRDYGFDEILMSLAYFTKMNHFEEKKNPEGYTEICLRDRLWESDQMRIRAKNRECEYNNARKI